MGFTQPCFIRKNTPGLRKKLEELGYTNTPSGRGEWFIPIEELEYLVTYPISGCYQGCNGYWHKDDFDCETNEELFLAIAALRDDSDYMQWFTDGEKWFQNKQNDTDVIRYGAGNPINFHKATVEEIIEHFKKSKLWKILYRLK